MENFRILLDLSDLEDKVHKYVWMLVSTSDLKYVADLKKSVISKLALNRNDIKMFINGGLLLEEEKIMILRENDIVQIQYEKLPDSVRHSSSYMEMLDNKLPLNIEEYNGREVVKHSKKHKRKSKEVSLEIANGNIEADLSESKRQRDVAAVDKLEVENENIREEEYNRNENVKHSKKHKRKSKEVSSGVANGNVEEDFSKLKRKSNVVTVDKLGDCKDEMLIQVDRKEKKHKKSFSSSPSAKDVIIQNERSNIEEMDTIPAPVDANTITFEESSEKSCKIEENINSKSSDIAVESFIQGSNCKKRKRKRSRKKARLEPNLMGPFMSANKNSLQKSTEISPPVLDSCDNFAGIRKHIKFTSPTPEGNNKEVETVDLKTNCSDSQAQSSPNKTCVSQNAKPSSFPTRQMHVDRMKQIANRIYSKTSSSSENTCALSSTENSSLAYANNVYKSSPKLSSKTCIELNSPTVLVSANPTFANYSKPELSSPPNQKSLPKNSSTASPMRKEIENKPSPEISKSKECQLLKPVIPPYAEYTPLKSLPPIGTHVAFKLLELDENYSPQISQYKEGIIKSINPKSEEIEIQLIKAEIKPGRIGKFENLNEDEVPSDEVVKMVSASWASLIEPRLISPHG